jgi:hypothetical protein
MWHRRTVAISKGEPMNRAELREQFRKLMDYLDDVYGRDTRHLARGGDAYEYTITEDNETGFTIRHNASGQLETFTYGEDAG